MDTMHAASRQSLAAARERLDAYADQASRDEVRTVGQELFAVVQILDREPVLRRHLSDFAAPQENRVGLLTAVFSDRVWQPTLDVLHGVVTDRWSQPSDLVQAVETLSQLATLSVAEKDGKLDEVEDELFRFGRILEDQPQLRALLSDLGAPLQGRVELLRGLLADKAQPATIVLMEQAVSLPRGRSLDVVAGELAELAAARRDRSVAHVTASAPLSTAQEQQLTAALGRIYRRGISLQVDVDPDLLGGLIVRVGEEVIDGSVASQLDEIRHRLAS